MSFESPDMAKDFPGLYRVPEVDSENHCKFNMNVLWQFCSYTYVINVVVVSFRLFESHYLGFLLDRNQIVKRMMYVIFIKRNFRLWCAISFLNVPV